MSEQELKAKIPTKQLNVVTEKIDALAGQFQDRKVRDELRRINKVLVNELGSLLVVKLHGK